MKKFSMILASDSKNGIGIDNSLPWKISKDMQYFKNITTNTSNSCMKNAVIMGRKTWESIPKKYRPLINRENFVLSTNPDISIEGAICCNSIEKCLKVIDRNHLIDKVFVIGGGKLYNSLLKSENLENIYITKIEKDYHCDTFFEGIPGNFILSEKSDTYSDNRVLFSFELYKKTQEI